MTRLAVAIPFSKCFALTFAVMNSIHYEGFLWPTYLRFTPVFQLRYECENLIMKNYFSIPTSRLMRLIRVYLEEKLCV